MKKKNIYIKDELYDYIDLANQNELEEIDNDFGKILYTYEKIIGN